ncbi:MAG: glycosyltransferase family 1 protein [Coriobacteriia bacterium]|nr:glycosyltransferase family 1 protein [Coriobacteriia bacterium]
MMRILLDCRMASWSGVGRYTTGLASALARRDDIALVVACNPAAAELLTGDLNAEVFSATSAPFSLTGMWELGRIARAARADVTHCPHFPTPLPAPHPLVVTLHDLSPLIVPGLMPSAAKRALYRAWNHRAVRQANRIVTVSENTARDLARFFPVSASKTSVVLSAADDFARGELGELPSWLEGRRYILSMGNTRPHKDVPTLVQAFEALPDKDVMLVLVGADVPGYVASVIGASSERVRFTGPVDDSVLRRLYTTAELFAFPSLYEGFGLPPLEAMALGTPVITTSAASLPEVVGDAAVVVPPGDVEALAGALADVLSDNALRARLSDAGRARAATMTWERTAKETIAVYERVVAEV